MPPEIQLFYKARNQLPKDETDFTAVPPHLTRAQRQWLSSALTRTYGEHSWQHRLTQIPPADSKLP